MFAAILNNLVHDLKEGIAVFQPSFHFTGVIRAWFRSSRHKHCQGLSSFRYCNALPSIATRLNNSEKCFLASATLYSVLLIVTSFFDHHDQILNEAPLFCQVHLVSLGRTKLTNSYTGDYDE